MDRVPTTADAFNAVAEPRRREILDVLACGERSVNELVTEVYEAMPHGEALNTLTLTEQDGRTRMTLLTDHASRKNRDTHVNSGMESGLQDALDLLDQVAASLPVI